MGRFPAWLSPAAGCPRRTLGPRGPVRADRPLSPLLAAGVHFPALTSLLSQKVRESERAFTYSAVGAGSQVG